MADLRHFMDGRTKTYDANLVIGPIGQLYTTSIPGRGLDNATSSVTTDGYVDLGDGYTQGFACFDLCTLCDGGPLFIDGGLARVYVQGAKDTSFTTTVPLAYLEFGCAATPTNTYARSGGIMGDNIGDETRYFVPFHNRYGDEMYRYVRMFVHLNASIFTIAINGYLTGLH